MNTIKSWGLALILAAAVLAPAPARAAALECDQQTTGLRLCLPRYGTDFDQWGVAATNAFAVVNSSSMLSSTSAINTSAWLQTARLGGISTGPVGIWISSATTFTSSATFANGLGTRYGISAATIAVNDLAVTYGLNASTAVITYVQASSITTTGGLNVQGAGSFSGSVTASSVTVEASGGTSLAVGRTGFSTRATLESDGTHGYLSTAGGAGALIFRVNNVEKARVHTDGNFGVGTNAPAATIHVDASGGGTIRVTRLGTGSGYIQIDADGTDGTVASTNKLHLNTNGAQRAAIDENGNFGIGSGATKSTFTATGFWEPISKTKAQIDALIPTKVGQVIYASDTTLPGLCVSTGTAAAQWRKMESATLGCGTNN